MIAKSLLLKSDLWIMQLRPLRASLKEKGWTLARLPSSGQRGFGLDLGSQDMSLSVSPCATVLSGRENGWRSYYMTSNPTTYPGGGSGTGCGSPDLGIAHL